MRAGPQTNHSCNQSETRSWARPGIRIRWRRGRRRTVSPRVRPGIGIIRMLRIGVVGIPVVRILRPRIRVSRGVRARTIGVGCIRIRVWNRIRGCPRGRPIWICCVRSCSGRCAVGIGRGRSTRRGRIWTRCIRRRPGIWIRRIVSRHPRLPLRSCPGSLPWSCH
jgi:hypothetical protein